MLKYFFAISSILSFAFIYSQSKQNEFKEMTLHDFMEDHVEIAESKFKKGKKEALQKILEEIPNLALDEDKEKWKKIISESIESEKLLTSCKNCHKEYKKSYKKSFRKRLVKIPVELLQK